MTAALVLLMSLVDVPAQVPASAPRIGPSGCKELRNEVSDQVKWCRQATAGHAEFRKVPLRDIAKRFAPILWFSPNEPLLWADPADIQSGWQQSLQNGEKRSCDLSSVGGLKQIGIPHRLPGDPDKGPAVYYQLVEYGGGSSPFEPSHETIDLSQVTRIDLRYFFYYLCDIGANAHPDDLEAIQFTLKVDKEGDDCRRLQIGRVTGFAHGLDWVYNRLDVEELRKKARKATARTQKAGDLLLPVTALVEEGKHASSPDRNGDGAFTPGYDVNKNVQEAWGVRDNFGSGLIVPKYHAEDSKKRHPQHRVFPAEIGPRDPLRRYYCGCSSPPENWSTTHGDDMDSAEDASEVGQLPGCEDDGVPVPKYRLESAYSHRNLVSARGLGDGDFGHLPRGRTWLGSFRRVLTNSTSVSIRWDQPESRVIRGVEHLARWPNLWTITLPGVRPGPLPGWLAARTAFHFKTPEDTRTIFQRVDLLLLPSAARWFDSYISLWGYSRGENGQLLPEVGYRIRLVSKEPPVKYLHLPNSFFPLVGLRIGLRLPSLPKILGLKRSDQDGARAVRLIVELGGGAF